MYVKTRASSWRDVMALNAIADPRDIRLMAMQNPYVTRTAGTGQLDLWST